MVNYQKIITQAYLQEHYVDLNKSTRQIGKELGCSRESVRKKLKNLGFIMGTVKSKRTGVKISEKHRLRIIANRPNRGVFREKSCAWKGDKACYSAKHIDIRKIFKKPKRCPCCSKYTTKLDLANISQKYLRVITDWEWLCRKCHMIKDGRLAKLHKRKKHVSNL